MSLVERMVYIYIYICSCRRWLKFRKVGDAITFVALEDFVGEEKVVGSRNEEKRPEGQESDVVVEDQSTDEENGASQR